MSVGPANSPSAASTLPRRQLGRYLRDWRTQAGLTIAEAAKLMEWGASTLQRLEKGNADRIRTIDIQELCRIYGIPDEIAEGLKGLAQQAAVKSWWHSYGDLIPENFDVYVGLEASAQQLSCYQSELVPGLLQTADYARALNRLGYPDDSEAELERRVQLRMQRQALITRRHHPASVAMVLHESVLHRLVGSAKVMAAQVRHLAELSTRDNVALRILPFSAGVPLGLSTGPFVILEFGTDGRGQPVEPPVVYVEGFTGDLYLERQGDVQRYSRALDCLERCASDIQTSRNLLRQVAKEFSA
ncbi:helix-turn-helix domain-containing protein [Nocardia otitidiscaviarum]|uniref:Helix-turn-helix domain-containing protein n=1 Tax=Nocardia otitidiscaviarum TaxID=1823 RepID=A0A516NUR7_9NOCA|nr:helix-turn-helix transcriptional regulator [Nocardia otitidiscaviarum]MBF6135749.1 helix-turn-helix domain-containing protein [Nocardia otitidiscaviarum]MBF6178662.1 helix-turn-helix domain-containing protein [Nocardia otitidiscaviarum]MBF6237851.1 helix-turn-helix domain-containing protein [Nocardia otitidiscaviarum]MBF6483562.1 helix-turn-helix domain-containing protein [Nocardia otitidiscaviarum]MCP9622068.1 helix-turn-helix domain-containing protein [Nocardia otitidiscaviarum]